MESTKGTTKTLKNPQKIGKHLSRIEKKALSQSCLQPIFKPMKRTSKNLIPIYYLQYEINCPNQTLCPSLASSFELQQYRVWLWFTSSSSSLSRQNSVEVALNSLFPNAHKTTKFSKITWNLTQVYGGNMVLLPHSITPNN